MLPSDITKMAQSFSDIAEGKDKDDSYLETDMKKRRKNNEKAVEDMKKVKDDTVPRWMRENIARESFYYKRLEVFNKVMAERYLAIAGFLVSEGYESPRLIDNIIEIMPKDVVGHDFRAAIFAVNPHLNENFETAEKKQARAIIREMDFGKKWKEFTNWLAPPKGSPAAADPKVRAGLEYTGPAGTAVRPNNSRASREAAAAATPAPSAPSRPSTGQGGRALGSTTQRQGGAVNPSTSAAPARPAPAAPAAAAAPAKPAPTAATKPVVKQTGNKAVDMAAWAKANPKLAAAQKIRQSGGSRAEVNKALYNKGTAAATSTPSVVKAGHEPEGEMTEGLKQMAAQVTDALPWNRNTEYTTQGKRRKPGENVHGQQTGKKEAGTASMSAGGTAKTNRKPNPMLQGGKVVQTNSYEYVRSKLIEGIRDLDPEKGTEERKKRLEKKRGMKLDDHPEYKKEEVTLTPFETSLYDIVVGYLLDENLAIDEDHAVLVLPELTPEEVAYIVDEYTTKHGKKAMDWNRSDDKPKTVAKNPKMPKKKEGKCSCCGNDPCTC